MAIRGRVVVVGAMAGRMSCNNTRRNRKLDWIGKRMMSENESIVSMMKTDHMITVPPSTFSLPLPTRKQRL